MKVTGRGSCLLILALMAGTASMARAQESAVAAPARPSWVDAMTRVHAKFRGKTGTFAHFGDSITETLAFWTPLKYERKNGSPEMERAFRKVDAYLRPECWRDWKGPEHGNQGGQTTRWADDNVAGWLEKLNPEVALVMFGTNDLRDVDVVDYRRRLRSMVRRCLDQGTVVILSTIPHVTGSWPRHRRSPRRPGRSHASRACPWSTTMRKSCTAGPMTGMVGGCVSGL